ncbi:unnamed protein product [Amoebophrya sp. A120]|nr:unnamed protein product [Amoebophrya sp. A120]|eukprot:GSA120T00017590001.1
MDPPARPQMSEPTPASSSTAPMPNGATGSSGKPTSSSLKREGNDWMKQKNYEKAIEKYTEAIGVANDNKEETVYLLHSNRAQAYINLKQYDKAMEDAETAIRLKDDWFKGYSHKATILLKWERYEEILEVGRIGLTHCEREADGEVLRQNVSLAKTGLFLRKIQGKWTGRVKDVMGGYRQSLEFLPEGRLSVQIMHRAQQCHYSARAYPSSATSNPSTTAGDTDADSTSKEVYIISFILPNVDARTPYLAKFYKDAEDQEHLVLCCNADVVKSSEVPELAAIDQDGDGVCNMTRPQNQSERRKARDASKTISERVEEFSEGYWAILCNPELMSWTEVTSERQMQEDPTFAAQSIKLQSAVFDLEEEYGSEVVDAFFLLVCDFDEDKRKLGLAVHTSKKAKEKVVRCREVLAKKNMLDFQALNEKKQKYLDQLKDDPDGIAAALRAQAEKDKAGTTSVTASTTSKSGTATTAATEDEGSSSSTGLLMGRGGQSSGGTQSTSLGGALDGKLQLFGLSVDKKLLAAGAGMVLTGTMLAAFLMRKKGGAGPGGAEL